MKQNYYQQFNDLSKVRLLQAINDYDGYTDEAKVSLKKVAIEKQLIDEDFNYLIDEFDEECKYFYETIICPITEQNLAGAVPLKIRFFHFLIDCFGIYLFIISASSLLTFLGYGEIIQNLPEKILGLIFYVGYFFFMELTFGKTLGKLITKTKVVDFQKQKPTTSQIFVRSLTRLIPFEQFSFFGEKPIGWHDSISRTYVVFDD